MANNLAISVSADVADLTAKMAVAQASVKDYGKTMREVAREVAAGDTTDQTKVKLLEVSDAYSKASGQLAIYKRELANSRSNQDNATASAGQMKAGMQNLAYQMSDVATMFSLGAPPMQIFVSQGSQVIQALQSMTGEAKGVVGILGSPWGLMATSAAMALAPLIAKMFEAKDAADAMGNAAAGAMAKLNASLVSAQSITGQAANEATNKLINGMSALAKANRELKLAESPDNANSASEAQDRAANLLAIQRRRDAAQSEINSAREDLAKIRSAGRVEALQAAARTRLDAMAAGSAAVGRSSGGTQQVSAVQSSANAKPDDRSTHEARMAEIQEAFQEQLEISRQRTAMEEATTTTQIALSRLALESKLSDLEAEARAGRIGDAQAIQRKAELYAQLDQLDVDHENRIFEARQKQLRDEMANYSEQTKEYREYLRRIEELQQQHQNRLAILKAQNDERRREQDRLLTTESNQRMTGMANTFAQNLARMATMQQGFSATVRGLWQGIAGTATNVIQQVIQQWLIGEMIKLGLVKATSQATIMSEAAKAGAGGTASMAAAPFPINLGAPAFGAAMFSAAQAYSSLAQHASGTSKLPNDRIALVHAGERIVPKADNDQLIALTKRGAEGVQHSSQAAVSSGSTYHMPISITALDGRSVKRMFMDHKSDLAEALRKHLRDGGR